jgi:uncharacterized protein YcgI (DUF1989 family)
MPIAIPARLGKATRLGAGQSLKLINTHGSQVVDTWAFVAADMREFMSMEHSRAAIGGIFPHVGDSMVTNRREPILTLLEDTSPGIHDTLIAACDRYRYEQLGCAGYHESCTDNLAAALGELGLTPPETPAPWNMWMNIPVAADGSVSFEPPVSKPGDFVVLRAERDAVVAFSCCPQDILPINGTNCVPQECHFEILD